MMSIDSPSGIMFDSHVRYDDVARQHGAELSSPMQMCAKADGRRICRTRRIEDKPRAHAPLTS